MRLLDPCPRSSFTVPTILSFLFPLSLVLCVSWRLVPVTVSNSTPAMLLSLAVYKQCNTICNTMPFPIAVGPTAPRGNRVSESIVFLCGSGHSLTNGGASASPSTVFLRILEPSPLHLTSPLLRVLGAPCVLQELTPRSLQYIYFPHRRYFIGTVGDMGMGHSPVSSDLNPTAVSIPVFPKEKNQKAQ